MRTADAVLRELDARLDLPARTRALLLGEVRADMDALVERLLDEGLTPEAAHERALRLLAPSPEDAEALVGLHRSTYLRAVARLEPARVRRLERVLIGGMAALAVLAAFEGLARAPRLPGVALLVLGALAAVLTIHLAWNTFRIVARGDASPGELAQAGILQAMLVVLTLSAGVILVLLEAWVTLGAWQGSGGMDAAAVAGALVTWADTGALALGLTILGVFGAVALWQWYASAARVEAELRGLLESSSHLDQE